MKILLRRYGDLRYVWETAKYNGNRFVVNGETVDETNIVSIINDNRKNYVRCSSCGRMFPKNGNKFEKHKEESSSINPCLNCPKLRAKEISPTKKRFIFRDDGTCVERKDTSVELLCHYSMWNSFFIDSDEALETCKFRQCEHADAKEITDTFTKYPGVFDDIITVDKILDNGYSRILYSDSNETPYVLDDDRIIVAYVNKLGIVDRFTVENDCYYWTVWYSKKYSRLFTCDDFAGDRYAEWKPDMSEEKAKEITDFIAKFYE